MSNYSPMNLNCIGAFLNNSGLSINQNAAHSAGYYSNGYYSNGDITGGNFLDKTKDIFEKAFDIRYPIKSMGQLQAGRRYFIRSIGTPGRQTDFTLVGAPISRMGVVFKATGDGADIAGSDGTVNDVTGNIQTGMTLPQYTMLLKMGSYAPFLTNTPPPYYVMDLYTTSCRHGFIGQFAVQAFEEFYITGDTPAAPSYTDFFNVFSTILGYKDTTNSVIDSLTLGLTHLDGIYSNMNDLITGDITGVTLSTFFWGQDLINLGRALDLQSIQNFGNPDNLLRTIAKNKAITTSLNIAFAASGLSTNEVINIINGQGADNNQQKLLYACYNLISGSDLNDVLIPLNCQTKGLDTLADLLDLRKIFPNSYETLTFPQYNSSPKTTNSKTYYLLYNNKRVNKIASLNYGNRLAGILPEDIAYACDAFSMSMRQIKNIQNIDIEKFAQVVTNLENVTDLQINSNTSPGVQGTSIPTNVQAIKDALAKIAFGSSTDGKLLTVDFFASMTNLYYPWDELKKAVKTLEGIPEVSTLQTYFQDLYTQLCKPGFTLNDFSNNVVPIINNIDSLVENIFNAHKDTIAPINDLYNHMGGGLSREQLVRRKAIAGGVENVTSSTTDVYSFIDNLSTYSSETEPGETASVIESIADITTLGGQSLIGSMREARNSQRMGLMGGELDNKIETTPLTLPIPNGTKAILPTTTGNVQVSVTNGGPIPGSLGGSPHSSLVPKNLTILNMSTGPTVLVPGEAIAHVSACNCDCWDLLK